MVKRNRVKAKRKYARKKARYYRRRGGSTSAVSLYKHSSAKQQAYQIYRLNRRLSALRRLTRPEYSVRYYYIENAFTLGATRTSNYGTFDTTFAWSPGGVLRQCFFVSAPFATNPAAYEPVSQYNDEQVRIKRTVIFGRLHIGNNSFDATGMVTKKVDVWIRVIAYTPRSSLSSSYVNNTTFSPPDYESFFMVDDVASGTSAWYTAPFKPTTSLDYVVLKSKKYVVRGLEGETDIPIKLSFKNLTQRRRRENSQIHPIGPGMIALKFAIGTPDTVEDNVFVNFHGRSNVTFRVPRNN